MTYEDTGFTLWLTGLSGAGKSTLAAAIAGLLRSHGGHVEVLDGDEIRRIFGGDLGYSPEHRMVNMRRIGYLADLLSRNGVRVVVAAMSPYRSVREEIRGLHTAPFLEVFVDCPLDELVRRDTKGLYARALSGELQHVVGVSDPYEPPVAPELHLRTNLASVDQCMAAVTDLLRRARLLETSR